MSIHKKVFPQYITSPRHPRSLLHSDSTTSELPENNHFLLFEMGCKAQLALKSETLCEQKDNVLFQKLDLGGFPNEAI